MKMTTHEETAFDRKVLCAVYKISNILHEHATMHKIMIELDAEYIKFKTSDLEQSLDKLYDRCMIDMHFGFTMFAGIQPAYTIDEDFTGYVKELYCKREKV